MNLQSDVGVVGLGVMGANLAKNFADHGASVVGLDLDDAKARALGEYAGTAGVTDSAAFVRALARPRRIMLLVPAGKATEGAIDSLTPLLDADDILIDGGNARWQDTQRRQENCAENNIRFVGCGVSGGEVGARYGPSMMPGGDQSAWDSLRPLLQSIAAKVDPKTGREIEWHGDGPYPRAENTDPCVAWIGPGGSGHFVKMVHNGIEYAVMQILCEAYALLHASGMKPAEMADVYAGWNEGDLSGYLVEITTDILRQTDPVTGKPFVDIVLDAAAQKGTGAWTVSAALDFGQPAPTIAEAVFARSISALKDERVRASKRLDGPANSMDMARNELVQALEHALFCAILCAYAQGFEIIMGASRTNDWSVNPGDLAHIWRGGCIIRAELLHQVGRAFVANPELPMLLFDESFASRIGQRQAGWRRAVALGATCGVPLPGVGSALAWYDSARSVHLPANLLQAQRDFFGSHTYERTDQPRGKHFHLDWSSKDRPQSKA